jgi:hypothetical protein
MKSSAQSNVGSGVTHGAINRVADMAGRKVADIAMQKAMPALKRMDTRKALTVAALVGIGFITFWAINRDVMEV